MELHKILPLDIESFRPNFQDGPIEYFKKSWAFANKYYGEDIARIGSVEWEKITPEFFFREYIWVVHATGFSAKAVGKFLPRLLEAYGPWQELGKLCPDQAIDRVKVVCNNPAKIHAVWEMARTMELIHDGTVSWETFREKKLSTPALLTKLPYIGKITCFHLGRNIGLLECVKPDLHLVRMAEHWGIPDCVTMCKMMRDAVDPSLPLGLVDLALWFIASTFGTIEIKKEGQR